MNIGDLIRHYRFLSVAARKIGVSRATLYNWQAQGHIPPNAQARIERLTKGELKADAERAA